MPNFRRAGASGVFAALWLSAFAAGALDLPNLSGTWHLDKSQSDDLRAVMRSGRPGGGGGSGGGGGYRHGGGGGHMGGGRGSSGGGERADSGDSDFASAFQTLVIDHTDPRLSITDADGRTRIVFTDGRKTEEEHSHGGTTKVQAEWKDGRIQIVSKPETGPKRTEELSVTADRTQLRLTIKLEVERSPVTIHLVFLARETQAPDNPAKRAPPAELPPEL